MEQDQHHPAAASGMPPQVVLDDEDEGISLGEIIGIILEYRWLVAAQLQCRGWDEYQGLQQALRRYATFAAHYRDRWRQFISDTTRPDGPGGSLSIPHHRLVHFLLAVDEIAAARSVVEAMVDTIVEDFSDQPLTSPAWLGQARA